MVILQKNPLVIEQFEMENPSIFKFGKPSISMDHLYHGYVRHNQRVYPIHIPLNHYKIPLNHHKIPLNHYKIH